MMNATSLISMNLESLSEEQLEEKLNCLANKKKLKNQPHYGKKILLYESISLLLSKRPSKTNHQQPNTDTAQKMMFSIKDFFGKCD